MSQSVKRIPASTTRMALSNVVRGRQSRPLRVMLYGVEGVGKSTFASQAPNPIFLCAEDGTSQLDVARFPSPATWLEVFEALGVLMKEEHEFRTLVIDTLDWLEPLCWAHVCAQNGKGNIEDFGYGKGYVAALDQWRMLVDRLDQLVRTKKMHVILIGHAAVRKIDDPHSGAYDRYRMKLHERAGDLWREWVDAVLFARHEVFTVEKKGKQRGVSSGRRVIHTQWNAAFDAKNRFDLPEQIDMDFAEFQRLCAGDDERIDALRAEVESYIKKLAGSKYEANPAKALEWAKRDIRNLKIALEKLSTQADEIASEKAES